MKQYAPHRIHPNVHTLDKFMKDNSLSQSAYSSMAYKAVYQLFETAQNFYGTLESMTSSNMSVFIENQQYLTALQEHDLVALTAQYISQLNNSGIQHIVANDPSITDDERTILKSALKLFSSNADTTIAALGHPRWIE
jgi:hypothetical protein